MSFSNLLKNNNLSLWNKSHVDHPFIKGIQDGSLEFDKFKYYMIQDYKFLIEYCRVISIAISKSFDQDIMSFWSKLLDETLNSEMTLHESFCSDFGITKEELFNSETSIATKSYCNYLLSTAHKYDIQYISCSLLPCQWGYDEIGRRLGQNNKTLKNSFHERWIQAYNDKAYQEITNWLINYVDSIQHKVDNKVADEIFQESLEFEFLFWESSWNIR
ncbi:MAG: thiaminase II [Dehalococcoidia bacterium]|nr:thiaminase II [Chloroflexota bacterium]RZP14431.1 MAG: thiaminase II [Chloroflexota bacterium]|tara:strand:- start:22282 stop:22932 length:651 start_codon:yes stop_codon:yes gene_type:complete